jgi:hypothetical protein
MHGARRLVGIAAAGIAAALILVGPSATAHDHLWNGVLNLEDDDGFHHVFVNVGKTVLLTVQNQKGQSCLAEIAATTPSGGFVSMKPLGKAGAVPSRQFEFVGLAEGTTGFDITVKGVSPCTEDSHNLYVVQVLPSETAPVKSLTAAYKSEGKLLGVQLRGYYDGLRATGRETTAGVADGSILPETGAGTLLDAWYVAWSNGLFAGRDTLRNLSNYGTSLVSNWPECTGPRSFFDGSRGPYDALTSDVRRQLSGYWTKLDRQIGLDVSAFRKATQKYDIDFDLNYRLLPFPELDVAGPTRSARPDEPAAPLQIAYGGGATFRTPFSGSTCVGFAGVGDPALGPIRLQLFDGDGLVSTKTATAAGKGTWSVMYDDVTAGKTYRLDASYEGGGGHDTTRIGAPIRF